MAHEFEGGDVVLGLDQQVHRQEPARQRQLGRLEDGATDDAALVPAAGALQVQPTLAPKRTAVASPAIESASTLTELDIYSRHDKIFSSS